MASSSEPGPHFLLKQVVMWGFQNLRQSKHSLGQFSVGDFCPSRGHLAVSRDIFGCNNLEGKWKGVTGM